MKKSALLLITITVAFVYSCKSEPESLDNTSATAVVVTRTDDLKGNIEVYIDGKKNGAIIPGGTFSMKLPNGRHSISVMYKKQRSEVKAFRINYNRQHYRVTAFENTEPGIMPF
ncbi:MAG: hypothetical protein Pg6A_19200 [Termitinemataceae bacterium]|nr:MAG: hypothetical protein Pg6A_19200 [Termitinemataceae bacterium]